MGTPTVLQVFAVCLEERDRRGRDGVVKGGGQVRQQPEASAGSDLLPGTPSPIHQLTQLLFGGLV